MFDDLHSDISYGVHGHHRIYKQKIAPPKNVIGYPGMKVFLSSEIPFQAKEWRNEKEIYQWCRQNTLLTQSQHDKWLQNIPFDKSIKMFGIVQPNMDPIGVCGLTNIDYLARHAEFSLYIAPEFQQRGFGLDGLITLFRHGFEDFNLNKIWGETFEENPAIYLFQKLGMEITTGHRSHYYKNGEYINTLFASILKDEWDNGLHSSRNISESSGIDRTSEGIDHDGP